jgi:hypothetical protein
VALEAENLADARQRATANVAQVARVAKQEGYDGIVFTGDFGLPAGKREIDLRELPDVKAPENAGNPAPIGSITPGFTAKDRAAAKAGGTKDENEAISAALERLGLAEEAGTQSWLQTYGPGWSSWRGCPAHGRRGRCCHRAPDPDLAP